VTKPKAQPAPPAEAPGVTSHVLAEYLACNVRTVEKYAEQGLVHRIGRGRYDLKLSVSLVTAHLRKQASLQVSQDGREDAVAENVAMRKVERRMKELRLAQMEGTSITIQEVEDAWAELVTANRQLVLSIPSRARAELPHLTGQDQKDLMALCHEILTETALGEGKRPKRKQTKVEL
jgi:phage terminase Nu1 subunit (DNA packaging protein)